MGLKGYRLWFMGQLDSNVQSPTEAAARSALSAAICRRLPLTLFFAPAAATPGDCLLIAYPPPTPAPTPGPAAAPAPTPAVAVS